MQTIDIPKGVTECYFYIGKGAKKLNKIYLPRSVKCFYAKVDKKNVKIYVYKSILETVVKTKEDGVKIIKRK